MSEEIKKKKKLEEYSQADALAPEPDVYLSDWDKIVEELAKKLKSEKLKSETFDQILTKQDEQDEDSDHDDDQRYADNLKAHDFAITERRAIEKNDKNAQYELALGYNSGYGVLLKLEKNEKQAEYWCEQAAMNGHPGAKLGLPGLPIFSGPVRPPIPSFASSSSRFNFGASPSTLSTLPEDKGEKEGDKASLELESSESLSSSPVSKNGVGRPS